MLTYLEYIRKYYPDIDIDAIFDYAGVTRYEVEDAGHWFTQDQTDRFHEIIVAKTGNPKIARDAGRFTVSSERLGAAKQYALGLITMSTMYLMVGKLANSMTRGSTFKAKKKAATKLKSCPSHNPGSGKNLTSARTGSGSWNLWQPYLPVLMPRLSIQPVFIRGLPAANISSPGPGRRH